MRTLNAFTVISSLVLAAGCSTYPDHPTTYNSTPAYSGQVVSSPAYTTYTTNYSTPYYTDSTVSQGSAAVSTQTYYESDSALINSVRQQLNRNSDLAAAASNVQISAANGTVSLTGTVPTERDRQLIDNVVRNIAGVASVHDQMHVSLYATGRADQNNRIYTERQESVPAGAVLAATGDMFSLHVQDLNPEDRTLGQRVLEGLRADTVVAAIIPKVGIHVQNGRIILRGTVQNDQQRQAIVAAVQRASGTGNVQDELRVGSAY
jgi:osmotically-inducible protein OsmY